MGDVATAVVALFASVVVYHVARVGVFALRHRTALRQMWTRNQSHPSHPAARFAVLLVVLFIVATWEGAMPERERSVFRGL